jgi:hypothetical protein
MKYNLSEFRLLLDSKDMKPMYRDCHMSCTKAQSYQFFYWVNFGSPVFHFFFIQAMIKSSNR